MPRLILASSSPRRQELLAAAGFLFEVIPPSPESEDEQRPDELPALFVLRMARQKAESVARRLTVDELAAGPITIIGCDTIVVCRGQILGKPADRQHAQQMLRTLRGTEHYAVSGLCLLRLPASERIERVESTTLRMAEISDSALQEYLESGLWQGKAGGFGYQDRTGWLQIVAGSDTNVVGLPLETLTTLLNEASPP